MKYPSIEDAIADVLRDDSRYDLEAYIFVKDGLDFTVQILSKPTEGPDRHVSGKELLDGLCRYAVDRFGPMAMTVLGYWGIKKPLDFGEIVFNMVEHGILGKTEEDTREDFDSGCDFFDVFVVPFLPASQLKESGSAPLAPQPPSAMGTHD